MTEVQARHQGLGVREWWAPRRRPGENVSNTCSVWLAVLGCACVTALPRPTPAAEAASEYQVRPLVPASLAVWRGWLVAVTGDQRLGAWRTSDLSHDEALSRALARGVEVQAVGADGDTLLACTAEAVLAWDATREAWRALAPVPSTRETLDRFVVWPGNVALLYWDHVLEARSGCTYPVPELESPDDGWSQLALRDAFARGRHLWLGSSQGEWGGHLVGLDLATGDWVQRHTELPVTGIAADGEGLVTAASLSHLHGAGARLERRGADGAVRRTLASFEGFLQKLDRGPDGTLWAVEQRDLVRVDPEGRRERVAGLPGLPYGLEPDAVGVAPGVVALRALDPETVAVLPETGDPVVVRRGQVRALEQPRLPPAAFAPVLREGLERVAPGSNSALPEAFCQAYFDHRDRWAFADEAGGGRRQAPCAGAPDADLAAFLAAPARAGRWVFSDARGRTLAEVVVERAGTGVRWQVASWHENGQREHEVTMVPGRPPVGRERTWHRNGQLRSEQVWREGQVDGTFTLFFLDGTRSLELHMRLGVRHGPWTEWYRTGQKKLELTFREGQPDGTLTEWHRNGQRRRLRAFRAGEPIGAVVEWDEAGRKTLERPATPEDARLPSGP